MPIRKEKPYIVAMKIFEGLPNEIKDELDTFGVDKITSIMQQAQLSEGGRYPLSNIVYGLFIGELHPSLLSEAVKEELGLEEAKAQLVGALVRKAFVEPHIEFLTKLYQGTPKINPKSPLVPEGNVVNLAKPR